MNTYKIAATTRAGDYIETEITAKNIWQMMQSFMYQLAVQHNAGVDDIVELDITELE